MPSPAACSKILVPVLYISLLFFTSKVPTVKGGNVTALYAFGDSILDTGNNNNLITLVKCNFLPYGRDFPGGPTGRWGNGKVFSDLMAEALGIKDLMPAFGDPSGDPATGVCFASGGSGLDPTTVRVQRVVSKEEQINNFKQVLATLQAKVGAEQAKNITSKALFLTSFGNNDIAITYYSRHLKPPFTIGSYTSQLVSLHTEFLKALYDLGARRFGVMSTIPLGCLPAIRTAYGGLTRGCSSLVNNAATMYNSKLQTALTQLGGSLPGATINFVDVYGPLLEIIQNPLVHGFLDIRDACCGPAVCTPLDPLVCPLTGTFLFWDEAHPSEKAYRIIVSEIAGKYLDKF